MLAWNLEFRDREPKYARAQVLGTCTSKAWVKAERIENQQQREVKKRLLEPQYRDPARDLLNAIQRQQASSRPTARGESLADLPSMRLCRCACYLSTPALKEACRSST